MNTMGSSDLSLILSNGVSLNKGAVERGYRAFSLVETLLSPLKIVSLDKGNTVLLSAPPSFGLI